MSVNHISSPSGIENLFTKSQTCYSTKHPEKSDPLKAMVNVTDNTIIQGIFKTTTQYVADILDPAWTAVKNAGSILSLTAWKAHGIKTIPKALWWTLANTGKATTNSITGLTRGLDKAYTNIVTDNITDISSGTIDRVPWLGGKFFGNITKGLNALPASFIRTLGNFLPKKIIDETMDSLSSWWIHKSGKRRLNTEGGSRNESHEGGHH